MTLNERVSGPFERVYSLSRTNLYLGSVQSPANQHCMGVRINDLTKYEENNLVADYSSYSHHSELQACDIDKRRFR